MSRRIVCAAIRETYDERRERERWDPDSEHGPGHETYDEKVERWRRDWDREDSEGLY